MPGIGWPVVISSTMCEKDVGYGAGGSAGGIVLGEDKDAVGPIADDDAIAEEGSGSPAACTLVDDKGRSANV